MREGLVHDIVINNTEIQQDIKSILNIDSEIKLIHEDTYINGIIADFTLTAEDEIRAIIECKAGDINVTDYVRGIGQLLQYEYFNEQNISPKNIPYAPVFNSVLLFPSSVVKINQFNLGRFKYPKSSILIELNEISNIVRKIEKNELDKLSEANEKRLTTISQYYVRDNRIYEYYILLKYLTLLKFKGVKKADRKKEEEDFLKKLNTQNNGNWRNAFISLSSLGLIDSNNIPTSSGVRMANYEYETFALEIYKGYIKPYFVELISLFSKDSKIDINNQKICEIIRNKNLGRDILFLTESKGRYLSSWMNILRDDYGCIQFDARSSKKELVYNILELNDESIKSKIKENSIAYNYLERYYQLVK